VRLGARSSRGCAAGEEAEDKDRSEKEIETEIVVCFPDAMP
jgi:hypothetical protein